MRLIPHAHKFEHLSIMSGPRLEFSSRLYRCRCGREEASLERARYLEEHTATRFLIALIAWLMGIGFTIVAIVFLWQWSWSTP